MTFPELLELKMGDWRDRGWYLLGYWVSRLDSYLDYRSIKRYIAAKKGDANGQEDHAKRYPDHKVLRDATYGKRSSTRVW